MEDLKTLASSIAQIAEEKGIAYEKIIEVIEMALVAAYKKRQRPQRRKYSGKI